MRYLLIILFTVLGISTVNAQTYERKGNTFEQTTAIKSKVKPEKTPFTWVDSKGIAYHIYITQNGRCYVLKVSKNTGKEYKHYLPVDLAKEICKSMNREYKELKSK